MGLFDITWRKQGGNLLPPGKRSASMVDFMAALLSPLQSVTSSVGQFATEQEKRARFNGQKIVLQAALNDIFLISEAPFIVVETQTAVAYGNFIYGESEGVDVYTFGEAESEPTIYIFDESEAVDEYDFLIKIPVALYSSELERRVRAEVETYKMYGKSFNVITY